MKKITGMAILCFLLLAFCGCISTDVETIPEAVIENAGLKIVCAPRAGGRIVGVFFADSPNLMDSDRAQYLDPIRPESNLWMKFFHDPRGQVFWSTPQSEWWRHQQLFPDKKRRGSPWPPDPYLEFGRCRVSWNVEKTSVRLESEFSPITGLVWRKEYTIEPCENGARLILRCEIENSISEDIVCGIWSVTRPLASATVSFPGTLQKLNAKTPSASGLTSSPGAIRFRAAPDTPRFKAMLDGAPDANCRISYDIAIGNILWRKEFQRPKTPAPGHAPAELLFCPPQADGSPAILEVESHGECRTLKSSERMTYTEIWTFHKK